MHGTLPAQILEAREIERKILRGDAKLCSASVFGRVCKAVWGSHKTAEQLAGAAHCSVRAAAYQISGESAPSAQSLLAVMTAIVMNSP